MTTNRQIAVNFCLERHFPVTLNKLHIYTLQWSSGFSLIFYAEHLAGKIWPCTFTFKAWLSLVWGSPSWRSTNPKEKLPSHQAVKVCQAHTPLVDWGLTFSRFPASEWPFKITVDILSRSSYRLGHKIQASFYPDQTCWKWVWALTALLQASDNKTIAGWWNWVVIALPHVVPSTWSWLQPTERSLS